MVYEYACPREHIIIIMISFHFLFYLNDGIKFTKMLMPLCEKLKIIIS